MPEALAVETKRDSLTGLTATELASAKEAIGGRLGAAMGLEGGQPVPEPDSPGGDPPAEPPATGTIGGEDLPHKSETKLSDLDPAVVRSLKGYKWTDEEIKASLEQLGNRFVGEAEKIHRTRLEELKREADYGRRIKGATRQQIESSVSKPVPATQPLDKTEGLTKADIADLKAKYGNDPLLDEIFSRVNNLTAAINELRPQVRETHSQLGAQRDQANQATIRRVNSFFDGKGLDSFRDRFGLTANLTAEQHANRRAVLQDAAGLESARLEAGQKIDVEDALQLMVDANTAKDQIRVASDNLKKQLKQRNAGITSRPTHKSEPNDNSRPGTMKDLQKRVKPKLAQALGHS